MHITYIYIIHTNTNIHTHTHTTRRINIHNTSFYWSQIFPIPSCRSQRYVIRRAVDSVDTEKQNWQNAPSNYMLPCEKHGSILSEFRFFCVSSSTILLNQDSRRKSFRCVSFRNIRWSRSVAVSYSISLSLPLWLPIAIRLLSNVWLPIQKQAK